MKTRIYLPRPKREISIAFARPGDEAPSGTLLSVEAMIVMIAESKNISVLVDSEDDSGFNNLMPWLNAVAKSTDASVEILKVTAEHKFLATITKDKGCQANLVKKIIISPNGMFYFQGVRYLLFDIEGPKLSKKKPGKS